MIGYLHTFLDAMAMAQAVFGNEAPKLTAGLSRIIGALGEVQV